MLDTTFTGMLIGETTVGDYSAVLPTITGRGWVTGRTEWVLDDSDPFPEGYTIGDNTNKASTSNQAILKRSFHGKLQAAW